MVKIIKLNPDQITENKNKNNHFDSIHFKNVKKRSPKKTNKNNIQINIGEKIIGNKINFKQRIKPLEKNARTLPTNTTIKPLEKNVRTLPPKTTIKPLEKNARTLPPKMNTIQVRTHKRNKKIPTITVDMARDKLVNTGIIKSKNIPDKMIIDMYTLMYDKNINIT